MAVACTARDSPRHVRTKAGAGHLVRHQYRYGHGFKYSARRTAEHKFPQTRVTIATHHQEVSRQISCERQQVIRHVDVSGRDAPKLDLYVMAGKMLSDVGT